MRECQGANQLQTNLSVLFVELFFAKDLCFFGLSPKTENFRHFYFYLGHPDASDTHEKVSTLEQNATP